MELERDRQREWVTLQVVDCLLTHGATPAVIEFSEETLAEVSGVVIPAIINESENDQAFILALHASYSVDGILHVTESRRG